MNSKKELRAVLEEATTTAEEYMALSGRLTAERDQAREELHDMTADRDKIQATIYHNSGMPAKITQLTAQLEDMTAVRDKMRDERDKMREDCNKALSALSDQLTAVVRDRDKTRNERDSLRTTVAFSASNINRLAVDRDKVRDERDAALSSLQATKEWASECDGMRGERDAAREDLESAIVSLNHLHRALHDAVNFGHFPDCDRCTTD
jgi:chromosome segregation ATPase